MVECLFCYKARRAPTSKYENCKGLLLTILEKVSIMIYVEGENKYGSKTMEKSIVYYFNYCMFI